MAPCSHHHIYHVHLLPVVEGEGSNPIHPPLLQLILQVPPETSPEKRGKSDQGRSRRDRVPVNLSDDIIIQGHDITQLSLEQPLPAMSQ